MDRAAVARAAALLAGLRNGGSAVADLGIHGPQSIEDAHAVQDEVVALIGEPVAGYKVFGREPDEVMRGAILASRMKDSDFVVDPRDAPMLGIEVEIAFRLERDFVLAEGPFDYETLARAVTALPAIEIVATRFESYEKAPLLHRLGDMMSNGFLIVGEGRADWRDFDLEAIGVSLRFDGKDICRRNGGHAAVDPLLPALALINSRRLEKVVAGQVITTGTYTGVERASPGVRVDAEFEGFGAVSVRIGEG